jgi:hypothetical protein
MQDLPQLLPADPHSCRCGRPLPQGVPGIAQLDGRQRDVMALHCLAGYEISEVAEMLGINSATVRVHLHDGRRHLLKIMAPEEGPA